MDEPRTRFTGIFIPAEILECQELTLFEMLLLSWIDALYCAEHGGCFASNEYLAKKMKGAKVNTVVKALIRLRKLGLIIDVSFNGRRRVIRACIGKAVDQHQSQAACDLNHMQGVKKITGCIGQKSQAGDTSHYIYDSKEERKEEDIARTTAPPRSTKIPDIYFSFEEQKFLNITQKDTQTWSQLYPSVDIARALMEMIEWIKANPSKAKSKKLWRKFILGWLRQQNEQLTNRAAYRESKKEQVLSRHTGFQKDTRPHNPSRYTDLSQE